MKKKAIQVEYRKTSESFPDWMKYEITILQEDGKTVKVPAYGKDLQDALSRVVHDDRVEKITKTTEKLPSWIWIVLWFSYLFSLIIWFIQSGNQLVMAIGVTMILPIFGLLLYWGQSKNKDKKGS
jgi:cell division protein FtsX